MIGLAPRQFVAERQRPFLDRRHELVQRLRAVEGRVAPPQRPQVRAEKEEHLHVVLAPICSRTFTSSVSADPFHYHGLADVLKEHESRAAAVLLVESERLDRLGDGRKRTVGLQSERAQEPRRAAARPGWRHAAKFRRAARRTSCRSRSPRRACAPERVEPLERVARAYARSSGSAGRRRRARPARRPCAFAAAHRATSDLQRIRLTRQHVGGIALQLIEQVDVQRETRTSRPRPARSRKSRSGQRGEDVDVGRARSSVGGTCRPGSCPRAG